MRRELKVPLQFAGVRVKRQNAGSIEIVAGPRITHKIGRCVAGGPIDGVEFRIIGSGHPGRATAVQIGIARPTGGAEFSGPRNRPALPFFLSGCRIERGQKSPHAGISARGSHNDFVLHHQRSTGCVRRLSSCQHIPRPRAGHQSGHREPADARHRFRTKTEFCHTPTPRFLCAAASSSSPELTGRWYCHNWRPVRASRANTSLAAGHEHHASDYNRGDFQVLRISWMENPGGPQLLDICGGDFSQSAIAASGVVPVVGGPIRADRTRQQVLRASRLPGALTGSISGP